MEEPKDTSLDECKKLILAIATEKDPSGRLELSNELSIFLTNPGGLVNLFSSVIDFDTSSQKLTTHNQRFLAIATMITRLPNICMPYENYCTNLMQQLKPILRSENPLYSSLASIIVKAILNSPHSTGLNVTQIVIEPILAGLTQPEASYSPADSIVIIHNLIVNGLFPKYVLVVFSQLFYSSVRLHKTPSRLKSLLKTCLTAIISYLKPGAACCLLEKALFYDREVSKYLTPHFDDEEVSIQVLKETLVSDTILDVDLLSTLVLDLIKECNNEQLTLEFFFHFQECMWNKDEEEFRHLSATLLEPLLDDTVEEKSTSLDLSRIIATNQIQCSNLVHRTLVNYLLKIKHPENNVDSRMNHKFEVQSIKTCLNILEVLSCLSEVKNQAEISCENFVSVLKELKHELETRNPRSEIIVDLCAALKDIGSSTTNEKVSSGIQCKTEDELSTILRDLNDKIIPVQVHAIIRLKQLIISNDAEIVSKIPHLFTVIATFLENQEPYVFLACIGLVSEMALRKTDYIMPKLIKLHKRQDLELQARINMGEVLVRLLKQMNDTAPKYAQQVMNSLINSCQDKEELIRMSSLTNIGELCTNLKASLGDYIFDVLSIVKTILIDDTVQVKTAAIDLLRTTLSGLNRLTIESIQRDLKTIYDILKRTKSRTFDEHLCLQTDLALDEIDRIARELILADDNKKLVKNIRVLTLD